jgi:hypothetical protein
MRSVSAGGVIGAHPVRRPGRGAGGHACQADPLGRACTGRTQAPIRNWSATWPSAFCSWSSSYGFCRDW